MAKANFDPSVDRYTRGIIRRKAKQLIRLAGFTEADREDLEQDLLLRVVKSWPKFDPRIAHRNKFIKTVVVRCVANLVRDNRVAKRDPQRVVSLNVLIEVGEERPTEWAQNIGERDVDARLCPRSRDDDELVQLALDMADLIVTLPESDQTLLELRKTRTMQEVAEEMGVPRTTLNDRMRHIRRRFENAGMRVYLES